MIPTHRGKGIGGISTAFLENSAEFTLREQERTGGFYRLTIPFYRVYVATEAQVVRHIMVDKAKCYLKGKVYWQHLALALGNGMATAEGRYWLQQRRSVQPFYYKSAVAGYVGRMGEIAERFLERELGSGEVKIDAIPLFNEVTAEMTLRILFGVEPPTDGKKLYGQLIRAQEFILQRSMYPWGKLLALLNGRQARFERDVADFDRYVLGCIASRREDPTPENNVLTAFSKSQNPDGSLRLTDQQIRDEFITQIGAGSETSSACLAWTLYLLSQHPGVFQTLRDEVDAALPSPGERVDGEVFQKLIFTKQVIQESLRLFPPGYAIVREAQADDEILGEPIPKGTSIYMGIYALHRNPKYFDCPDVFRPERFALAVEHLIPKHAWIPFGAGPHLCIGIHFALAEMQVLLATLVRRFDFELARPAAVKVLPLATLKPEGGMPFLFRRRV